MSVAGHVSCVLCHRSKETKTTGALSTKDTVTAHQNCLMHPSIIEEGDVLKCTTVWPSVFGCPLCPKFTTASQSVIQRHLRNHAINAVHFKEKIVCRCNLPCRDGSHFHCPFCGSTVIRKDSIIPHLLQCKNACDTAQLPSAPPSPPPSPETHPTVLTSMTVERSYTPSVSDVKVDHSYTQTASPKTPDPSQSPPAPTSEDPIALKEEVTEEVPPTHVKCPHCQVFLYKRNLFLHIQRKHGQEKDITAQSHFHSTSVDQSNGLCDVRNTSRGLSFPVHVQRNTWGPVMRCDETEDRRQYHLLAQRSGLSPSLGHHTRSLEYYNTTACKEQLEQQVLQEMLFSSGIYCESSPLFDDLFGFSVQDVLDEVRRGRKLNCSKCKKKGATAGCEVQSCKKSYHFPCAVEEGAKTIEDQDNGKYGLLCFKHNGQPQRVENNGLSNGLNSQSPKARTSKSLNRAGSSKVFCLACEKTEGNIRLESLSNSTIMLYCDKHAPSSHQRDVDDEPAVAGPSNTSSDPPSKRRMSLDDEEEVSPSKRRGGSWPRISEGSSSDENEPNTPMEIFAPLESDLEDGPYSAPELQFVRTDGVRPTESPSGINLQDESMNKDEDETIVHSDNESQSLLPPSAPRSSALTPPAASPARAEVAQVRSLGEREQEGFGPERNPAQQTTGPSVPQQTSARRPNSPDRPRGGAVSLSPPKTVGVTLVSPVAPPIDPDKAPGDDAPSFWRSCNAAGCTRAIFTNFINEMNDISDRIQSDQASREDYDRALTVMSASGRLADLVAEQQKELQRKQMDLTKAAAAMSKVAAALRR